MKLSDLLAALGSDVQISNAAPAGDREVASIVFDSRKIEPGCIFVAVRGEKADGHRFLTEAAQKNAAAVVVEDTSAVPAEFKGSVVKVRSSREALNKLANTYFGKPSASFFNVGVTGTNGKTTVTHMVEAIFDHHGWATGVIGTINHHLRDKVWKTEMTTPDPVSFQSRLAEFKAHGAKALAMEVSSHALSQSRVDEVPFDVAIFTNLSRDHLDYHKDMEDYFQAKRKLFAQLLANSPKSHPTAVINADDDYGQRLAQDPSLRQAWTYGLTNDRPNRPSLAFRVVEQGFAGTRFELTTPQGAHEFSIRMSGLHNVYNAAGAIGAALAAGIPLATSAQALANFNGVKGRLESVPNSKGVHVFVDYAHTDGALETVLHYLGGIRKAAGLKNQIITVFGCGGDRDKGKRPLMMKAAAKGSDLVVLTSDNPRTEDPEAIIADAFAGADASTIGKTLFKDADRRQGIRKALDLAKPGDVVLIAGKGHEDYQQIGTVKHPFSDVEVVKEILK